MPELPEVEASRRLIETHCIGSKITSVIAKEQGGGPRSGTFDDVVFEGTTEAAFLAALKGRTLVAVHRKGKQLWWTLSGSGPQPMFHLGMSGAFQVQHNDRVHSISYVRAIMDTSSEDWPPRFSKLEVQFSNSARLVFTDPRRFGAIELVSIPDASPRILKLGPDAHDSLLPLPEFNAILRERTVPVKSLLLDQSFVAGIGNWIADEVLYAARIHPASPSCALNSDDAARLHEAIRSVLSHAVSTNADYAKFPVDWLFHKRWGKGKGSTSTSEGRISFVTVGGRTSAVVLAVQRLLRKQPVTQAAVLENSATSRVCKPVGSKSPQRQRKKGEQAPTTDNVTVQAAATRSLVRSAAHSVGTGKASQPLRPASKRKHASVASSHNDVPDNSVRRSRGLGTGDHRHDGGEPTRRFKRSKNVQ